MSIPEAAEHLLDYVVQVASGQVEVAAVRLGQDDFIPWKKSKLQVIGVYNAPTATLQGNRIAVYNVDIAFQQKIGNDKARFGLIVTDIFNTQKNGFIWNTPDFNFSRIFKVDARAVLLTFAYTFGTSFKEKLMENKFSND